MCIRDRGRELDPDLDLWSTAKPFLEKWMLEQMGPQRLWRELRAEAPHYAKLLPELPRLIYDARCASARQTTSLHCVNCWKRKNAPTGCCKASFLLGSGLCWACCSSNC